MFLSCSARRTWLLGVVLAGMAAAASGGAVAQNLIGIGVPALEWPGLTKDDYDRMQAAAARLYEGRSIGTIERWRSPDTRDAGEVKLVQSFDVKGMPCHTIDYTIRFDTKRDRPDHYILNWCRVSDGTWKIVEVAPPHSKSP